MNKDDFFSSERLCFRGIDERDTNQLVVWRSDPEVIRYFRQPEPITKASHQKWYQNHYRLDFSRFDFIAIEKTTGNAIGTVGVSHINQENHSCEISYMIAEPAYQRRGYAVEAIAAMMKQMLHQSICCFFAEVHSENTASRRTIEKLKYTYYNEHPPFIIYYKRENMDAFYTR